jgi:hypothetical protein
LRTVPAIATGFAFDFSFGVKSATVRPGGSGGPATFAKTSTFLNQCDPSPVGERIFNGGANAIICHQTSTGIRGSPG